MFNKGDLFEVVENKSGHGFAMGEIIKFVSVDGDGTYRFRKLDDSDFWWVNPCDMKLIENKKEVLPS